MPYKWILITLVFSQSIAASDVPASRAEIARLIQDFRASYDSTPSLDLPQGCVSDRFIGLQRARFNIFRFHHSLFSGSNFKLLFNREPAFLARSFEALSGGMNEAPSLPEEIRQDALILIDELLAYQQKIVRTPNWEAAFDTLLTRPRQAGLDVANVYHDVGFARSADSCYHKRQLFDVGYYQTGRGTEGWLYSFWLRRYREGNFRLTGYLLNWSRDWLNSAHYSRLDEALTYMSSIKPTEKPSPPVVSSLRCATATTPSFVKAQPEGPGQLSFSPPSQVNWKETVPEAYPRELQPIDYKQFSMIRSAAASRTTYRGTAKFTYKLDPGCIVDAGHYYEIRADGLRPLQLRTVRGEVTYFLRYGTLNKVQRIEFGGKVLADSESTLPAFVLLVENELTLPVIFADIDSLRAEINERRDIVVRYETESSNLSVVLPGAGPFTSLIDDARGFQIGKQVYIFVRWNTTKRRSACSTYYSLFRVGSSLELVTESIYGCDV